MFTVFICFVVAVAVGAWRQMCGVYEIHMPFNCPSIWRNKFFRITTWLISTILSLVFALLLSKWVIEIVNEWVGKFSFGVFLYTRWLVSGFIGAYPAMRRCQQFTESNAYEHVDYEGLAESIIKIWRENGNGEISKEKVIAKLKDSAQNISTNNLSEDEQKALDYFKEMEKSNYLSGVKI